MVMFEIDGWSLEQVLNLTLRHECKGTTNDGGVHLVRKVFVYPHSAMVCWRCTEKIPEGIHALYRLFKWGIEE